MKPQGIRVSKKMSSSLWENNSETRLGEIKIEIQPEPVETVNIEMEPESNSESMQPSIIIKQEIKDEEIQTVENDPSTNYDEDALQIRVICEKIVRKLLAAGKKYCSNCYDIFENSDGLSAHLANATANGNCSQDYSEQGPVDILNGCKINIEASVSSTSSPFSSASPLASAPASKESVAKTMPKRATGPSSVPFSSSTMKNTTKNNTKIAGLLYKCPFCPVPAQTLEEHDKHILIHITDSTRAFTCTLCPPPSSDDNYDDECVFNTAHDWFCHVKTCHDNVSEVKEKRGRGRPLKIFTSKKSNKSPFISSTSSSPSLQSAPTEPAARKTTIRTMPKRTTRCLDPPSTSMQYNAITTTKKSRTPTTEKNRRKNHPIFSSSGLKNNNNKNNTIKVGLSRKCPFCRVTATVKALDSHMKIHITGKCHAYTCALCRRPPSSDDEGVIFGTVFDWLYHVKACHVKVSKVKEKRGPGRPLKKSSSAKVNEEKEKKNPRNKCPATFVCSAPGCKKTFGSAQTFKHHVEVHEGKLVEYSCQFPGCPDAENKKNWDNLKQFKQHMICHRNQPAKTVRRPFIRWLCTAPDCFNKYRKFDSYMNHVIHHRERQFFCSICQIGGYADDFLKRHEWLHDVRSYEFRSAQSL